MYKVNLWVPTKGWKLVKRTRTEAEALAFARSLLPLEVKVQYPGQYGKTLRGGRLHVGNYDTIAWEGITEYGTGPDVLAELA